MSGLSPGLSTGCPPDFSQNPVDNIFRGYRAVNPADTLRPFRPTSSKQSGGHSADNLAEIQRENHPSGGYRSDIHLTEYGFYLAVFKKSSEKNSEKIGRSESV